MNKKQNNNIYNTELNQNNTQLNENNITIRYIFSRFNEDISWFSNDTEIMNNAIIYNKGKPLNINNEIILEDDVGMDNLPPLKFIIDNYDNLPDICVFSQARIDDHYVYGKLGTLETLKYLKDDAIVYGESPYVEINDVAWSNDWNLIIQGHDNPSLYKDNIVIKFIDWFNINIDKKSTCVKRFHPCGIYSVSKHKILSRNKEYYINLFNQVNRYPWNCIENGFMERSWYHIFNPDFIQN